MPNPRIDISSLPSGSSVVFKTSSFFLRNGPEAILPLPSEVRTLAAALPRLQPRPPEVRFPSLGLIVKWGPHITIGEGQCMWAIPRILHGAVRVPEVYGWEIDGGDVFIYMQLLDGVTLEERWASLTHEEKTKICIQLRTMLDALRTLEQGPDGPFIGSVNGGAIHDIVFINGGRGPVGPFSTIAALHDCLSALPNAFDPQNVHPARHMLVDTGRITFSHSDLHHSNIIVSAQGADVVGIIDWHQSGWMPAHWEYCKLQALYEWESDWHQRYLPMILDVYDERSPEFYWYEFFTIRLGV